MIYTTYNLSLRHNAQKGVSMKLFIKKTADQLWNVCGDFERPYEALNTDTDNSQFCGTKIDLQEQTEECGHGVYSRKDYLTNSSPEPIHVTTLRSRFALDGGEYEVYTQYNSWQNESTGQWAQLNTSISVHCDSVRSTRSASPFLVLWNLQTGRGIAFHLLADASWIITASHVHSLGEASNIVVELGLDAPNLDLIIQPNESFEFPEILYYEVRNKTDMDCWKLHRYCNDRYPRRTMPVIYNTWLYQFDKIDFDNVAKQIPAAADLGAEYFVIDAGWFGIHPNWEQGIGDWVENKESGFQGKMAEISSLVRKHAMKFGLWLEVERAIQGANAPVTHSQFFIKNDTHYFLDFANPEAQDYIFKIVSGLIAHYQIEFIKFDFNADLCFDRLKSAFTAYFKGYRQFIERLRKMFPHVYLENCGSGGERMTLTNIKDFDSFWPTDNQSPYEGMRIFKDTILRMPPQIFERWAAIASIENVAPSYTSNNSEHILSTGDAVWGYISSVEDSFLKGFLSGGPLGFSCDLTTLSKRVYNMLKEQVKEFKQERSFWISAECRILADTDSVLVLQFNDRNFEKIVVQIFTKRIMQTGIHIYPITKPDLTYCISNENILPIAGKVLETDGLYTKIDGNYKMTSFILHSKIIR